MRKKPKKNHPWKTGFMNPKRDNKQSKEHEELRILYDYKYTHPRAKYADKPYKPTSKIWPV